MTIPKEIVDKMEQVNALMLEIEKWTHENIETDGSKHSTTRLFSNEFVHQDYYEFTNTPTGTEQDDGEYCEQHQDAYIEDSFYGKYYYPTEKGNYFWFWFEV